MGKRYPRPLPIEELAAMPDEEIDFSDIPELGEDFFRNARLVMPSPKQQVTVHIDADVLDWFKAQGKGYQSRMNAVLRAYVATRRER